MSVAAVPDVAAPDLARPLTARDFACPKILLAGTVDYAMYDRFRQQLEAAPATGLVVTELSTLGGDPEVARMIGEDIRFPQRGPARPSSGFSRQGGHLFGRRHPHELLRAREPLPDARDAGDDP